MLHIVAGIALHFYKTPPDKKFAIYVYGSFFALSHFPFQTTCCKLCKLMLTILLFNLFSFMSNLRPNFAKGRFGSFFANFACGHSVKFFPKSSLHMVLKDFFAICYSASFCLLFSRIYLAYMMSLWVCLYLGVLKVLLMPKSHIFLSTLLTSFIFLSPSCQILHA